MPPITPAYFMENTTDTPQIFSNGYFHVKHKGGVHVGIADIRIDFVPRPFLKIIARLHDDARIIENYADEIFKISIDGIFHDVEAIFVSTSQLESSSFSILVTFAFQTEPIYRGDSKKKNFNRVIFHLVNFPEFYCNRKKNIQGYWRQVQSHTSNQIQFQTTLNLALRQWSISIEPMPMIPRMSKSLESSGGYGITHVGELIRKDGHQFTGGEAVRVLEALYPFLSFVRGAWTGILLPVGFDEQDQKVWEEYRVNYVDEWRYFYSWFHKSEAHGLNRLFSGFWKRWRQKDYNVHLRNIIYWYLMSNHEMSDGGIILTQAGLELSAWLNERISNKQVTGSAADRIRSLLDDSTRKIPVNIPGELSKLLSVPKPKPPKKSKAKKQATTIPFDGPYVFTTVRNEIVHPDHSHRGKLDLVKSHAYILGQWYFELVLLRLFGFRGVYCNRIESGQKQKVPWK